MTCKTIDIPMLSAFDKFWHDCLDKQPTDIYVHQMDNGKYNSSKLAMLPIFKAGYESAQSILSQGEPENKVIDTIDYDEKLKSFYINGNQPSTEALQKKR